MFGLFSKRDEPQKMIEQLMRDAQKHVPKLSLAVAQAYANRRLVEQEYQCIGEELERLDFQISEAVKEGGEAAKQVAITFIGRKRQLQQQLPSKKRELDRATEQAEEAQLLFKDYMHEMDRKFTEIRALLPKHEQTKALESYAKLKQAFEVGDDSRLLEEVSRRIQERLKRYEE
jgi:phage shock protein A